MKTNVDSWYNSLSPSKNDKCFTQICRENPNTHVMLNNFLRISCRLWDNVEKYCRTGQATDDDMAHAYFMPDNWVYNHTLRIYNT